MMKEKPRAPQFQPWNTASAGIEPDTNLKIILKLVPDHMFLVLKGRNSSAQGKRVCERSPG